MSTVPASSPLALFDERLELRQTILHFVAIKGGSMPILNLLSQYPGFRRVLNSRDQYGRTCLLAALNGGHLDFVLALLNAGADPCLRSGNGMSALHFFAKLPWNPQLGPAIVAKLVNGADLSAVNTKGETALHVAAVAGNDFCTQAIIAAGGDLNIASSDGGDTPLIYAVRARKPSIVNLLVRANASLTPIGTGGTALEIAAKMQAHDILPILQQKIVPANPPATALPNPLQQAPQPNPQQTNNPVPAPSARAQPVLNRPNPQPSVNPNSNPNPPILAQPKTALPRPGSGPQYVQGQTVLVVQQNNTLKAVVEQFDVSSSQYLVTLVNQSRVWVPSIHIRSEEFKSAPPAHQPIPQPAPALKEKVAPTRTPVGPTPIIGPAPNQPNLPSGVQYTKLPTSLPGPTSVPVHAPPVQVQIPVHPAPAPVHSPAPVHTQPVHSPAPVYNPAPVIQPPKTVPSPKTVPKMAQPLGPREEGGSFFMPNQGFNFTPGPLGTNFQIPRGREELDTMKSSGIYRNPTAALTAFLGDSASSYTVQVLLPYGQTILMNAHQKDSYSQIQRSVLQRLISIGLVVDSYDIICDSKLRQEDLSSKTPFFALCQEVCLIPKVLVVPKEATISNEAKVLRREIGSLIGHTLAFSYEDLEITTFRERATRLRWEFKNSEASTSSVRLDNPSAKFNVSIHLPGVEKVKGVQYSYPQSADDFKAGVIAKEPTLKQYSPSDLRLKVVGKSDYLEGPEPLSHFEFIRDAVLKGDKIHLALVEATLENTGVPERFDPVEESFLGIEDTGPVYAHERIVSSAIEWDLMASISLWELNRPYRAKVVGIDMITVQSILGKEYPTNEDDFLKSGWPGKFKAKYAGRGENCMDVPVQDIAGLTLSDFNLVVTTGIYLGGEQLSENLSRKSELRLGCENPRWDQWLDFDILMCNLPREAVVSVAVEAVLREPIKDAPDSFPIGWANYLVFDYKNELSTGEKALRLWPGPANPIVQGTCVPNPERSPVVFMETEIFALPVVFPTERLQTGTTDAPAIPQNPTILKQLDHLINTDPLHTMDAEEKSLMWQYKEHCSDNPKALPKVLLSVPYNDFRAVQKLHSLLDDFTVVQPLDALELLGSRFGDTYVRTYAAKLIDQLPDEKFVGILLQLVQGLKYEPYHDSQLARILLRRGLANRKIGHYLFWYLKSELHNSKVSVRYELLLEAYLRGLDSFRSELRTQNFLQESFISAGRQVQTTKDRDQREQILQAEISKIKLPEKFSIPLAPTMEAAGLIPEKCRCMVSKKVPLWLTFINSDPVAVAAGRPIRVMFKSGDDLNQDMLTLQVIRLMDKEWQAAGLDLQMSPYGCVATGDNLGFIEVVENAETLAKIQGTTSKGKTSIKGVFNEKVLANWLSKQPGNENPRNYEQCIDRFVKSCAGYCVATYILGIGDRHNDNLMMTRDGKLFHIDFGHFLGNIKKKLGMKREKAPFVFTPDMAYLMGGEGSPKFKEFEKYCCDAYLIIRKTAKQIMNLFAMMLSTGIPELRSIKDMEYLRKSFSLELDDNAARTKMLALIKESLYCKTTRMMFAIHIGANKS